MVGLGTSTSNVDLAMSTIYANNRELVDDDAPRFFFVGNGVQYPLIGDYPEAAEPPVHPDHDDRGTRHIPAGEAVLIEADDIPDHGERIWLKGLGCFQHTRDALQYTGDDISAVREEGVDVIHWVPAEANVPVRMRTMDGDVEGFAEPDFAETDVDDIVQFERVGFARVDKWREAPRKVERRSRETAETTARR